MSDTPQFTNHLCDETSPYLLQHVHNPVDWYPWGEEALSKAREEDKPIFLSIGYAACHWCHVMEHESFENDQVAKLLNDRFVSIKVDREERPDLDEIYMTAVQMLTGSGGWPMTVFLTPDLEPFYGGTYFPPDDRWGRPGFLSLIRQLADLWQEDRGRIDDSARQITDAVRRQVSASAEPGGLSEDLLGLAIADLQGSFDSQHGGFGEAPKFPASQSISLLLRTSHRRGDESLLALATKTLDEMSYGGMYDQLGGGFHRYSVDAQWLVPHFEKMLYDNAQLAQVYLEAWQLTGRAHYRTIVEDTLDYVLHRMTDEQGGFYSTEDADSEGEEGKYYIWTHQQIRQLLGDDADLLIEYYQVQDDGNFSSHESYHAHQNILHLQEAPAAFAEARGWSRDELLAKLAPLEETLLAARDQRVRPGLDDKVLVSWNAMMISAFAKAAQALERPDYAESAKSAADFILSSMRHHGQLLHTWRNGTAKLPAYLDDYALLAVALVDLYETTFDTSYLKQAEEVADQMLSRFWDDEAGGLFYTGDEHPHLIARTKSAYDGATPSGNSVAASGLQRLGLLLGREDLVDKAKQILTLHVAQMQRAPRGFMQMLLGLDLFLNPPPEVVIAGDLNEAPCQALITTARQTYLPNRLLVLATEDDDTLNQALLTGKEPVDGEPAAYVCRDFACQQPVTSPEQLKSKLESTP